MSIERTLAKRRFVDGEKREAAVHKTDFDFYVKGPKEKFRRDDEMGYYPDRFVESTVRVDSFIDILGSIATTPQTRRRLFELVIYNSFGNVFPKVDSAGDFVGVPDERKNPDVENCVSLVIIKGKDGKKRLAVAGGFSDLGEEPVTTAIREGMEESGVRGLSHYVSFAERSSPARALTNASVSICGAAVFDPKQELKGGDDAESAVTVPLFFVKGGRAQLNKDLFKPGTHIDVTGRPFSFDSMRDDHEDILVALYNFWRDNGQNQGWTLSETLRNMSQFYEQPPFTDIQMHKLGIDGYDKLRIDGRELELTPNIRFTLDKAEQIFKEAGEKDYARKAQSFVVKCIEADVLPIFPQPAVATDSLIFKDDNLIVAKDRLGNYRLLGGFYSPERDAEAGTNLAAAAQTHIKDQSGLHPLLKLYLGTHLQKEDPRFPTTSTVFAGVATDAFKERPGGTLSDGTEIVIIPVWADKTRTTPSPQITASKWYSDHLTIVKRSITSLKKMLPPEDPEKTIADILLEKRLI